MVRQIIRGWLSMAAVTTVLCGLIFTMAQQVLRLSGNDPQIQMAEDAADRLAAGEPLAAVAPTGTVDLAHSLAPFMIVYDDQGTALAATGLLHGQPPALPGGVLDYVRQKGEGRLSWQPEPGARFAAVVARVAGARPGFVLVARSLREIENRETTAQQLAAVGWVGALGLSLVMVVFVEWVVAPQGKNGG